MPSGNPDSPALVVLVAVPNADDGRELARSLVQDRLAACVNVVPGLTSVYRWQGEVHEEPEALLVVKTTPARYPELEAAIRARHPYEVPEILAIPVVRGFDEYLGWLLGAVR